MLLEPGIAAYDVFSVIKPSCRVSGFWAGTVNSMTGEIRLEYLFLFFEGLLYLLRPLPFSETKRLQIRVVLGATFIASVTIVKLGQDIPLLPLTLPSPQRERK